MNDGEPPTPLCVGKARTFDLEGKGPSQIRLAVDLCRQCDYFAECRRTADGTTGMVRAGLVYTVSGYPFDPEIYIRRYLKRALGGASAHRKGSCQCPAMAAPTTQTLDPSGSCG